MEYQILSNGVKMPTVGFGVFKTKDGDEAINSVKWALEAGYRHIDTAYAYFNEESVGKGIKASGVPREEIFVTTKVINPAVRARETRKNFEESLANLGLDYVDLYLIHWPVDGMGEAWQVMEELYKEGKIRAIGISNFHPHHYEELMKSATIKPMVNQIESNPPFNNDEIVKWSQEMGMVVEAWSPLGGNGTLLLTDETLVRLGKKYNKSAAQIIVRWDLQRGIVPLPKSANQGRIAQNIDVYDFELSAEDMEAMNAMNKNTRSGADPDNFNF